MHNKHAPILICLRTTIQIIQELNGSFLIPKHLYIINNIKALASCTTSVYVNLSKNSFYGANAKKLRESGCKGTTISDTLQIFRRLFSIFNKSFRDY